MINQQLLREVRTAVESATVKRLEEQIAQLEEVWVKGDELVKTFGWMTKEWVKNYGHLLPRIVPHVIDDEGIDHKSAAVYPLHKLQRMAWNGEMNQIGMKQWMDRQAQQYEAI